jgi:hypothetical protein
VHVPFPNTDDQPEIRFNHLLPSLLIAGHDPFTELLFLFEVQQGGSADLPQVALQSI